MVGSPAATGQSRPRRRAGRLEPRGLRPGHPAQRDPGRLHRPVGQGDRPRPASRIASGSSRRASTVPTLTRGLSRLMIDEDVRARASRPSASASSKPALLRSDSGPAPKAGAEGRQVALVAVGRALEEERSASVQLFPVRGECRLVYALPACSSRPAASATSRARCSGGVPAPAVPGEDRSLGVQCVAEDVGQPELLGKPLGPPGQGQGGRSRPGASSGWPGWRTPRPARDRGATARGCPAPAGRSRATRPRDRAGRGPWTGGAGCRPRAGVVTGRAPERQRRFQGIGRLLPPVDEGRLVAEPVEEGRRGRRRCAVGEAQGALVLRERLAVGGQPGRLARRP